MLLSGKKNSQKAVLRKNHYPIFSIHRPSIQALLSVAKRADCLGVAGDYCFGRAVGSWNSNRVRNM